MAQFESKCIVKMKKGLNTDKQTQTEIFCASYSKYSDKKINKQMKKEANKQN